MTPPAASSQPATPTGKVVSVTPATVPDASGNYVPGRKVTYQLASGQTGTVQIPDSQFNADAVKAAVMADAAKVADVANITF